MYRFYLTCLGCCQILQLNTKINTERNASFSGGQTTLDMYKRKLQAAELQIRELKKSAQKK